MNLLNRILVVLGLLIALPLGVALCVAPIPILEALGQGVRHITAWLRTTPDLARWLLGILFALAWIVICILLLVLELRRPPRRMVRLEQVNGGTVEVSLKTVAEHIAYALEQLPGVLRVHPQVSARRGAVEVTVDVEIAGDLEIPVQAARMVEVVRQVVEEKAGVRLARPPRVRLRAAPTPPAFRYPPAEAPPPV
ncbi:MAG: hypothetical protein RML46_00955 [Anaerolineae bacterium]|nr:alkaline shock response membrane anchor protein AmaP [Anaerolineae bacterium]MDW8067463.1 hypothetical protein [Anaerolineae bacterium]